MKYSEPPLTFKEQAETLLKRGLITEKEVLIKRLQAVNYYRLSSYWHPFLSRDNSFKSNTTLKEIWKRYTFDRHLRLIVLDAIERIEIGIRTNLIYNFVHEYGPFGYLKNENIPNLIPKDYKRWLDFLKHETKRSREEFVINFFSKHGDQHEWLPLGMAGEALTFGMLVTFFRGAHKSIKRQVSKQYSLAFGVLESWVRVLNTTRNICAHHSRLWNRELGDKPIIPLAKKHPEWHEPVKIENNRVFGILTILKYLLGEIAPQSNWFSRLQGLLKEYPEIPLKQMGFPEEWMENPIWKR